MTDEMRIYDELVRERSLINVYDTLENECGTGSRSVPHTLMNLACKYDECTYKSGGTSIWMLSLHNDFQLFEIH